MDCGKDPTKNFRDCLPEYFDEHKFSVNISLNKIFSESSTSPFLFDMRNFFSGVGEDILCCHGCDQELDGCICAAIIQQFHRS